MSSPRRPRSCTLHGGRGPHSPAPQLEEHEPVKQSILPCIALLALVLALPCRLDAREPVIVPPPGHLKILDWGFVVSWGGVAVIHHVTIENTSEVTYRDIHVTVGYYSTGTGDYGRHVANTQGVLKITVPPRSKATYLEGGATLGAGSYSLEAANIDITGAVAARR